MALKVYNYQDKFTPNLYTSQRRDVGNLFITSRTPQRIRKLDRSRFEMLQSTRPGNKDMLCKQILKLQKPLRYVMCDIPYESFHFLSYAITQIQFDFNLDYYIIASLCSAPRVYTYFWYIFVRLDS